MISRGWKLVGMALPVIGSVAALAAFTSPPFNTAPAYTVPMLWQCYSGLLERTSVICATPPAHPTNVIPSRTHYYLVQCKAQVKALADSGGWLHPGLGSVPTNVVTSSNLLTLAGLGADFWTNTPPAGMSTATNGWHGLRRVITNLIWTVTRGVPSDCNGSNVIASAEDSPCDGITWMETNFFFAVTNLGFPLHEGRNIQSPPVTTNVIYQFVRIVDEVEGGEPCDAMRVSTEYYEDPSCTHPGLSTNESGGECVGGFYEQSHYWEYYRVTNTITDPCAVVAYCGPAPATNSVICSRVAPITFTNCQTNIAFTAEEWYNSGATNTCAGDSATFTDATGQGLTVGWKKIYDYTSGTVTGNVCRTNFATARVPWAGEGAGTVKAWAIYDAWQVRKYAFNF